MKYYYPHLTNVYTCACLLSHFSRVRLFATPWTVARQAPLSMGFSRQEYWSGLPCPPQGDLPNPGIKPATLTSPQLAGGFFITSTTWGAWATFHGIVESDMTEQLTFSFSHLSLTPVQASKVDRSLL